jgi:hypothetical protein
MLRVKELNPRLARGRRNLRLTVDEEAILKVNESHVRLSERGQRNRQEKCVLSRHCHKIGMPSLWLAEIACSSIHINVPNYVDGDISHMPR